MADIDVIVPIPRLDPIVAIGKDELVEGGLEGAANRPVIALANQVAYVMERTYSKSDVDDLAADLQEMISAAEKGIIIYQTEAELLAAVLGVEERAAQARDTSKIFLWKIKSAAGVTPVVWGWVDTGQSDLEKARLYAQALFNQLKEYEVLKEPTKNLFNSDNVKPGRYISTQGSWVTNTDQNWKTSEYIKVTPGETYTLSGTFGYTGIAFFADNLVTSGTVAGLSHTQNLTIPYTFTVPAGANYLIFNVSQPSRPNFSNIQLEKGSAATSYEPGITGRQVKLSAVDGLTYELAAIREQILNDVRDYEVLEEPLKNLFNLKSDVLLDKFLSTNGRILSAAGWRCSNFIPVTPGETYTLSGSRGYRNGLGLFSTNADTAVAVSYTEVISNPYTFTVPAGCNYVVFNIASASLPNFSNIQLELGTEATSYEDGFKRFYVNPEGVKGLDPYVTEKIKETDGKLKPYDIVSPASGKNKFNERTDIIENQYMHTVTGAINNNLNLVGWRTSKAYPVTPGQIYTLSGTFGLFGVGFYVDDVTKTALSFLPFSKSPFTFTVPAGANYLRFNLEQPNKPSSKVQLEAGEFATVYEPGFDRIVINSDYISGGDVSVSLKASAKITGNDLVINTGRIEQRTRIKSGFSLLSSPVFNFRSTFIDGNQINNGSDDVPPIYTNGFEIGSNHGYAGAIVTAPAHGKTISDIGSLWQTPSAEFIILDILDNDRIFLTKSIVNSSVSSSELTFTHKQDAANTADIVGTGLVSQQVYPVTVRHKVNMACDGVVLNHVDATYSFNKSFDVSESYGLIHKNDMVAFIRANKGKKITSYDSVAPFLIINNTYSFGTDGACIISNSATFLQAASFSKMMIAQAAKILGNNLYYYIPKMTPLVLNGVTFDFSKGVLASSIPSSLTLTQANAQPGINLPDRYIQKSDSGCFVSGVLPVADGEPVIRKTNTARSFGLISSALKQYHHFIDSADISAVVIGQTFAGKAYRKPFTLTDPDKISLYSIYDSDADYLYIDYKANVSKIDILDLPVAMQGRQFIVFEKSDNVSILNKIATSQAHIKIDNSENSGYIVLKFAK